MVKTIVVAALFLLSSCVTADMVGPTRESEIAAHRLAPPLDFTEHGPPGNLRCDVIVADDLYHYVYEDRYGTLRLSDGKLIWEKKFLVPHYFYGLASNGRTLFIAAGKGRLLALEPRSGKTLWSIPLPHTTEVVAADLNTVYCELDPGEITAINTATHGVRWKSAIKAALESEDPDISTVKLDKNRLLVGTSAGHLLCLSSANGKILWRVDVDNEYVGSLSVYNGITYCTTHKNLTAISADGKRLWQIREDKGIHGKATAGAGLVFIHTKDNFLRAFSESDGNPVWEAHTGDPIADTPPVFHNGRVLVFSSGALAAYTVEGECLWRMYPKANHADESPGVIYSDIQSLQPYRNGILLTRGSCYLNGKMHKTNGVECSPSEANADRTIQNLQERLNVESVSEDMIGKYIKQANYRILDMKKDREGRSWALLESQLLGFYDDLWVARVEDGKCTKVLFTGTNKRELGSADWLERFAGNPELSKDSDGDGWTDVVEGRIGTDPARVDSDGDGLNDSQDRNPLTVPRELNEREQVLAAAFEGLYRLNRSYSPAVVVFPEGMEPFELAGRDWVIVPKSSEQTPLSKTAGEGTSRIRFCLPNLGFMGQKLETKGQDGFILWSPDHTRARLHIVDYFGNVGATMQDIELKKIGEKWVVVKVELLGVA